MDSLSALFHESHNGLEIGFDGCDAIGVIFDPHVNPWRIRFRQAAFRNVKVKRDDIYVRDSAMFIWGLLVVMQCVSAHLLGSPSKDETRTRLAFAAVNCAGSA
jgi:hypothetical protein